MLKTPRLIDLFPLWLNGGGIFKALENIGYSAPWSSLIASDILDLEYLGNRSGYKRPSPIVDRLTENGTLSADSISKLAKIIEGLYSERWSKLYATMTAEYNPIENYRMTEEGTRISTEDIKRTRSVNDNETISHGGTETISRDSDETETPAEVVTKTGSGTANQNKNVYGFNSLDASPVPAENQTGQTTTTDTETHSGTNKRVSTGSETRTPNLTEDRNLSGSGNDTESQSEDMSHTLSRHGNIGVTTSQQMLESERALWMWQIFDVVFADVDRILSIPIY